jgi:hypothetical protein
VIRGSRIFFVDKKIDISGGRPLVRAKKAVFERLVVQPARIKPLKCCKKVV